VLHHNVFTIKPHQQQLISGCMQVVVVKAKFFKNIIIKKNFALTTTLDIQPDQ